MQDVVGRQAGQSRHLLRDRLLLLVGDARAFLKRRGIGAGGEGARLADEAHQLGLGLDLAVVPGIRRIGRQELDQRLIVTAEQAEVEDGRDEDDAVQLHAAVGQRLGQRRGAGRSVALADDELGLFQRPYLVR